MKMKDVFSFGVILLLVSLVQSHLAQAENIAATSSGYGGGLLGLSSVNENVGTGVGYGLEGAYFFNENWGAGAFIRGGTHENGVTSFFWAGQGLYRFSQWVPGLLAGVIVGSGKFSAGGFSGNSSFTLGAKAAYDYQISNDQPITVGVDFSLMFIEPASTTLTVFNPVATAKWWF